MKKIRSIKLPKVEDNIQRQSVRWSHDIIKSEPLRLKQTISWEPKD